MAYHSDIALKVACRAEGPKTQVRAELCSMFAERLARAHPDRQVTLAGDASAPLTLVVLQDGKGRFMARVDRGAAPGPARPMARRGAALADFLDMLIAGTSGL